ncbi:MAG TPA: SxtJ family membrane protein [Thermoanaerobaculia bacterium]
MSSSPTERRQLVTFGVTMAIAFAIVAAIRVWRRGFDAIAITFCVVAAVFALSALVAPAMLAPIRRWWMRFAEILGWINTRILLILIFYLVVTPLGLVMRVFRRPPLDMARRDSYWTEPPRNSYGDRHYEKQF